MLVNTLLGRGCRVFGLLITEQTGQEMADEQYPILKLEAMNVIYLMLKKKENYPNTGKYWSVYLNLCLFVKYTNMHISIFNYTCA